MTVSFFLILGCVAAGLIAFKLSAFAVALIAPVLGLLVYFISGAAWTGLAAFGAMQLGYIASVAWIALFRRAPQGAPADPVAAKTTHQLERAKSPAESL